MEKPSNWFATVKMWKNHPKGKKSWSASSFSVPLCENQSPGFSVRERSTTNGLFQTIKILMGYTKRLHQLKHGVLFHLKFENPELFVNIKVSYFLFFGYVKILQSTIT